MQPLLVAFLIFPRFVPTIPPPPILALTTPVEESPEKLLNKTFSITPVSSLMPTIPPAPPSCSVSRDFTSPADEVTEALLITFVTFPLLVLARAPIYGQEAVETSPAIVTSLTLPFWPITPKAPQLPETVIFLLLPKKVPSKETFFSL